MNTRTINIIFTLAFIINVSSMGQFNNPRNLEFTWKTDTAKYDVDLSEITLVLNKGSFPTIDFPSFISKIEGLNSFYSKEPVIAYWIKLAKDGQRKELSSTQKRWAYGFKVKYDAKGNFAILEMRAKIGRKIKVYEVDGAYSAETRIDGQPAFIEKIYIATIEGGMLPKVQSIELYGKDTIKGEDRYENINP